ncbi:MAG TPA: DUF1343 domain-containing protein [Chthoniobacterales bacterium]|nr:DUF1343 domain-containing protein [Chthoniobacterales bacterium]
MHASAIRRSTFGVRRWAFLFLCCLAFSSTANAVVDLGIDVLEQTNYAILKGKRVGLVTNQTGVNRKGIKTRILLRQNCNLVALYTPEHGLDGTERAGRYVKSRKDRQTGVMAYSLYGPTRKPSRDMLRGVDVLVFDIQDIGCRGYTYISTMGKCMEAAGENNIPFVVLDRPNPLGGNRIEGPSVESRWISFVSAFPVPYVHGMTVGELAKMVNARGWAGARCDLTVVPMRGWSRDMLWGDTLLRWVPPSPNIPRVDSVFGYLVTGIVGELSAVDTGVGGRAPFESITAAGINAESFTRNLNSLGLAGIQFRPIHRGRGGGCYFSMSRNPETNLTGVGVYLLAEIHRANRSIFRKSSRSKLELFFKIYGSSSIRSEIERGVSASRIVASWRDNEARFRAARAPYLLY